MLKNLNKLSKFNKKGEHIISTIIRVQNCNYQIKKSY